MPIPMKPGRVERQDYEYKRNGTCVVLMAVEPLAGCRVITVTERRTKKDYAEFMKALAASYPDADKIVLVQDNLNTRNPSSFYDTFPASEAFALAQRFEMVYTPKKASWLNMAEIELSALSKQCLDRRIAEMKTLAAQVCVFRSNSGTHSGAIQAPVPLQFRPPFRSISGTLLTHKTALGKTF